MTFAMVKQQKIMALENASRYSSDNTSAGSYMSEKKKQEALEAG